MSAVSLRSICAAALVFGVMLRLTPEGSAKRIAAMCASCALVLMLVNLVGQTDIYDYALDIARYRSAAEKIGLDAQSANDAMSRPVIERECEEYIMDKARYLGVELHAVDVEVRWSKEGVWVPCGAVMYIDSQNTATHRLSELIEAELGVAAKDQEWIIEGTDR